MNQNTFLNIQHIYPFSDMEVLAGHNGLSSPILCVGVLDAPDSTKYVSTGEFVLTTGYIFMKNTGILMEIIQELHNRQAAALGIKMFRYIQDIPEECKKLANEYNLPLIFIPSRFSWNDILNPLIQNISMSSDDTSSFINVYSQLLRTIQKSQSVTTLLSSANITLNYPITLINTETKSHLSYPVEFHLPFPIDDDFFREFNSEGHYLGDETVLFCSKRNNTKINLLVSTLNLDDYQMMILWDTPGIDNSKKLNMLIYAALLIRKSILDIQEKQKNLIHKKSFLLENLFGKNTLATKEEASTLQINPYSGYVPALAHLTSSASQNCQEFSIYNVKIYRCFELLYQKYNIHASIGADGIFRFLIPVNSLWNTYHDIFIYSKQYGKRILSALETAFPNYTIRLLIGQPAQNWEDIPDKHEDLMTLTEALKNKASAYLPPIMHLHDMGASFLLFLPDIYDRLPDFCKEYFSPLSQVSPTVQENILETLQVYIKCGFNYRETSRALNVHHNTIRYRLEQFSDLTGLEITNQDDLLTILICLQYYDLKKEG